MKLRLVLLLLVIVGLGVGGWFVNKAREERESLLSGFFDSLPAQISSRAAGRVAKLAVREGDSVKAGQTLVVLEASASETALAAEQAAAEAARQQYLSTKAGSRPEDIQRQEAAVRESESACRKALNGPLPEEIRQAAARLRQTQEQFRKARLGSRPEEVQAADAAADQARAAQQEAAAAESLARTQLARSQSLYDQGAIAKQQLDAAVTAKDQASARTRQTGQAYRQALAQRALVRRGNRPEDIAAAREEVRQADQALKLLERGTRSEDIAAAKARVDEARAALELLKAGNRPEDVARAKAVAQQAKLQAQSTSEVVKERTIVAPTDGVVERLLIAEGDLVAPGTPIAQLTNLSEIWVRVYLPEDQLARVKVGDSATLSVDGVTEPLPGVVESIASKGEFTPANLQTPEERARQVFAIRIRLKHPDPRVKAGMYATVKQVGQWP